MNSIGAYLAITLRPYSGLCGTLAGWAIGKAAKGLVLNYGPTYTKYVARMSAEKMVGFFGNKQLVEWTARFSHPFVSGCAFDTVVKVANYVEWLCPLIFSIAFSRLLKRKKEPDQPKNLTNEGLGET